MEWQKECKAGLIPLEYGDRDISNLTLRDLLRLSELGCSFEFLGSQTELVSSPHTVVSAVESVKAHILQLRYAKNL